MIYVDPKYRVHPESWTNVGIPFVASNSLTHLHLFKQDIVTDVGEEPLSDDQFEEVIAKLSASMQETGAEYVQRAQQSKAAGGHMLTPDQFEDPKGGQGEPTPLQDPKREHDMDEIVIDESPIIS